MDLFDIEPNAPARPLRSPLAARKQGLERLESFLPYAGKVYAAQRNMDKGPYDRSNVSTLSPWVRHRLILEQEVISAVLKRHGFNDAQKFVSEVFWRTYFKGWLEHRPQVWVRYCADLGKLKGELANDGSLRKRYETAITGRSNIDCFDSWAQELIETGYLHNHARMWFASIWIFTLKLPWQLGADFFLRHLLDGDPASNTLSWRWVAGLHTKGKVYIARSTNIEKFTQGRFNPKGKLSTEAYPLTEPEIGPPVPLPPSASMSADGPFALLVTEEDCCPESLDIPRAPQSILGLTAPAYRSPYDASKKAEDFSSAAVKDALQRCSGLFGFSGEQREDDDWNVALSAFARKACVKTIITAYAPVGPIADRLAVAKPILRQEGIRMVQVRRRYDDAVWPHSTRGFFALRAKVPSILSELALVR